MLSDLDPAVNCVLVGMDKHYDYAKMITATNYLLREGAAFVVSDVDEIFPIKNDKVLPGKVHVLVLNC